MAKQELIPEIVKQIKDNLDELKLSHSLSPLQTYEQELDWLLALLHKIPAGEALTVDEAYYLTRCYPSNDKRFEAIKPYFVTPFIDDAEIYRRDLAEGDMDTLEDTLNIIRQNRK